MDKYKMETPMEAVTVGLYLALTAPTDKLAYECTAIAQSIVDQHDLSDQDVDTAKALALVMQELDEGEVENATSV